MKGYKKPETRIKQVIKNGVTKYYAEYRLVLSGVGIHSGRAEHQVIMYLLWKRLRVALMIFISGRVK